MPSPPSSFPIRKIAILGGGLLGGSLALSLQTTSYNYSLWARRQETVDDALALGIQASHSLSATLKDSNLIILCTPVGAMLPLLLEAGKVDKLAGKLITDVGSVKLTPRDLLSAFIFRQKALYIGSHPMAGSEKSGLKAAHNALFKGASCIITNDFNHSGYYVKALKDFWETMGCVCTETSSMEHDKIIALISHFPHILAAIGASIACKEEKDLSLAGNGLRDTTRIASGDPAMWAEILCRNSHALLEPLSQSMEILTTVQSLLKENDQQGLESWLRQAKKQRDTLPSPSSRS